MPDVRLLAAVALTLSAPAPLPAQRAAPPAAEVAAMVARYDSAWNRRDTTAVGLLLAPEYRYFSSRGEVNARAETMTFLGSPDYQLQQAERSELAVALTDPVAVVSSRWRGHGSWRGEAFEDDQRCGQTWLRASRTWQLLSEHCVQIASPPPTPSN